MRVREMFRKPIDREIQGVIIVGQGEETNVSQELDEYVVTRELQKLRGFLLCIQERDSRNHTEDGRMDLRFLWKW